MISATAIEDLKGKDVFLIGGGNSLQKDLLDDLPKDRVIALNSSVYHFKSCLALFCMDHDWYNRNKWKVKKEVDVKHKFFIQKHRPDFKDYEWIKRVSLKCDYHKADNDSLDEVRGTNSGCCVLQFLDKIGVSTVYMLGFDCKQVNGKSHSHDHYRFTLNDRIYKSNFIHCFNSLSKNIKNSKIYNCSNDTALKCFKYKSLKKVLSESKNS